MAYQKLLWIKEGSLHLHVWGQSLCTHISHCITWFRTQLILTTLQIRYHSHLWDHSSTGQL